MLKSDRSPRLRRFFVLTACFAFADVAAACQGGGSDPSEAVLSPTTANQTYVTVAGEDWKRFRTREDLRQSKYFWWFSSLDVHDYLDLMPDPLFGQVLRVTFPANEGTQGPAPRLLKRLDPPLDRMWYRFRMKFGPGWTTIGPDPDGHNNAYKVAFWTWADHNQRGDFAVFNTTQWGLGYAVTDRNGNNLVTSKINLPGNQDAGRITTEWTSGDWWEAVVLYEKIDEHTAKQHFWRRRLSLAGSINPGPWTYTALIATGSEIPRVGAVELGANKNKNNPTEMYIFWGPWEVVDGKVYSNPFGMSFP